MEDLISIFRQARCSVRHESLALRTSDLGTQVGLVALTVNTIISGAFGSIARNNNISDGDRGDVGTDGLNDGSSFMSGNTEIQKVDTVVLVSHCSKSSFFVQNLTLISRENCRFFFG